MNKKFFVVVMFGLLLALSAGLSGCLFDTGSTNFTITFYVDGAVYDTITITSDTTQINRPTPPTKEGHIFDDWYYDKNVWERPFTEASIADGISSNIKLYAHFTIDPASLLHTVSYRIDDTEVHSATVAEGEAIPNNYIPTKTGYTFVQWRHNGEAAPTVMGDSNIVLDAHFVANTYKIYFSLSTGESFATGVSLQSDTIGSYIEVTYDSSYASLLQAVSVTKAGKVFAYWQYLDGEYNITSAYSTAGNITLTPVWADEGTAGLTYAYVLATDSYAVVTNSVPASTTDIIIPMAYNGSAGLKPVTEVRYINDASIETILIQNSVTFIKESAFVNCLSLQSVVISTSVTTIEEDVFPPDAGIIIYCKAATAPDGWDDNWECGNTAIFNDKEYAASTYDISNPENIEVDFNFEFDSVMITDSSDLNYTNITSACNISGNTLIIPPSAFSSITRGSYTVRVNGILSAYFALTVYDDLYNVNYDKANGAAVIRNFVGENITGIFGGGIVTTDYSLSAGSITIDKDFLDAKKAGVYELLLKGANDFAEVLTVTVSDSNGAPYNVKLDCDINYPDYTILFDCDYTTTSTNYSYSIDGGAYMLCESGDTISSLDTATAHTLVIRCDDANAYSTPYALPVMSAAGSFIANTFSWGGLTYNKYIADQSEFNSYIAYLTHLGCESGERTVTVSEPYGYVEGSVYVSDAFKSELTATGSSCLSDANGSFDFPWSFSTGSSVLGNIATLTIAYSMTPEALYSTGSDEVPLYDNRTLAAGTRLSSYTSFAINNLSKTETIGSVQELDNLPYGVKPLFTAAASSAEAQNIYEAALEVCRTYISDSMTDYQKVAVINDWLAINVTYDYDAIDIMNLQTQVNEASLLNAARSLIDSAISTNPHWTILTPVRNKSNLVDLKDEFENVVKGLKVFRLQGVFTDKIAVCDGIASALKLMCLIEGIECTEVTGYAGEAHAWNKVKIGGKWYVADATWARSQSGSISRMTHQWLLVSDQTALTGTNPHYERNADDISCVQILATGDYDYYDNFSIGGGYDLVADSQLELNAIIAYYHGLGLNTAEFRYNMNNPNPIDNIQQALMEIANISFTYITPANDKGVWIVDITNL